MTEVLDELKNEGLYLDSEKMKNKKKKKSKKLQEKMAAEETVI